MAKLVNLTYEKADGDSPDWTALKLMILKIFVIPGYVNFVHAMCPEVTAKLLWN